METKKPRTSTLTSTIHTTFFFAREDPRRLPRGAIPISTPNKNRIIYYFDK